jgi:hypothetical protein
MSAHLYQEIEDLNNRISELEKQVKQLSNIILRAIGWVEEVHCSGEGAVQEQRSFINEMRVAIGESE